MNVERIVDEDGAVRFYNENGQLHREDGILGSSVGRDRHDPHRVRALGQQHRSALHPQILAGRAEFHSLLRSPFGHAGNPGLAFVLCDFRSRSISDGYGLADR